MSLSLDNTLGAAFIGIIVASTLLGVSGTQAWYYFPHQKDRWPLKMLYVIILVSGTEADASSLYLSGYILWSIHSTRKYRLVTPFTGVSSLELCSMVSGSFWYNASLPCAYGVVSLVIAEFALKDLYKGFSLTFHLQRTRAWRELTTSREINTSNAYNAYEQWLSATANVLAAAADVLIANPEPAPVGDVQIRRTSTTFDTVINKLILFVVNTGLLTTLCAIASLISIVVVGETFIYIAFFFCIGRRKYYFGAPFLKL
ncbi:hypothetical protein F5887DRAFT_921055 [Amanita rubescens]|nr:hypothetical protein F5887DRAFT_921055 [Amanita rubescens]